MAPMHCAAPQRPALSLGVLVKVAVAGLLFAVVARYVDVGGALRKIGQADLKLFLAATALMIVQLGFAAARWSLVARAIGFAFPWRQAIAGYFEAGFFNQALPSTIGGDAVRIWRASRGAWGSVRPRWASWSIAPSVCWRWRCWPRSARWRSGGRPAVRASGRRWPSWLRRWSAVPSSAACCRRCCRDCWTGGSDGRSTGCRMACQRSRAVRAWQCERSVYSFAGHLVTVVAFERLAASLGLPIGFDGALKALPAILLASAMPISISGWGVREGAGVVVLGLLGPKRGGCAGARAAARALTAADRSHRRSGMAAWRYQSGCTAGRSGALGSATVTSKRVLKSYGRSGSQRCSTPARRPVRAQARDPCACRRERPRRATRGSPPIPAYFER